MYLSTKSIEKCFKKCADLAANFELHGVEPGLLLAELELQLLLQRRRHALLLPVPFVHLAGTSRAAAFCSKKKSGEWRVLFKSEFRILKFLSTQHTFVLTWDHFPNRSHVSNINRVFGCSFFGPSSPGLLGVSFQIWMAKKEEGKLEFFRCKKKEQKPQALPFLSRIGSNKIQKSDSFLTWNLTKLHCNYKKRCESPENSQNLEWCTVEIIL